MPGAGTGVYKTTPPTLTNEQVSWLMLNENGFLKIVGGTDGRLEVVGPEYNTGSSSNSTTETKPLWNQELAETLGDITNETNATVNHYVNMKGYNHCIVKFTKVGGTDTVTMTPKGSITIGVEASAAVFDDIGAYGMGITTAATAAASYTADVITYIADGTNYTWLNFETVSSGGANDADYMVEIIKWYA